MHGVKMLSYEDAVPCAALSDKLAFARDWRPLRRGDGAERAHIELAVEAAATLISQRLPGLRPPSPEDVSVEAAGLGSVFRYIYISLSLYIYIYIYTLL